MALPAGCTGQPPDTQEPAFAQVDIRNSVFTPRELTIHVGQTVRWTNEDPVFRTITSGNPGDPDAGAIFDSNDLIPFDSFTLQFDTPGEFIYHSRYDSAKPGLFGAKIIVTE